MRAPGSRTVARAFATLAALLSASPAAGAPALHVIPFPDTPDASPTSHIIFSSLQRSDLKTVTVMGSSSGLHAGHLKALPDGAGTAFLPQRAFTPGERVSVTATLGSPADGTASGDPNATALDFSFTVAVPPAPATGPAAAQREDPLQEQAGGATQSFRSAPELHPPIVSVSGKAPQGDVLLTAHTPYPTPIQSGPMIVDGRGRLIWFRPVQGYATNLEAQRYHGQPVLTWFQQTDGTARSGEDVIVDRTYRTVATLHGAEGYLPDMHELQLTDQGTALIDAYQPVSADLTSIGGPSEGPLLDCVIQELDVRTGQVLWEWHALGHVPLSASFWGHSQPPGVPYDFFHLNSIQQLRNGNLLVSARHTWAIYEIDKKTGRVIWTLGGRDSSFRVGAGAGFEWQHDAHLNPGGILSLFDDASTGRVQEENQSSAKLLRLNTTTMTASLVRRYTHRPPLISGVEGSAQLLPNQDVFVGWGSEPRFSEYSASGGQIFSGSLPLGSNSYRAYLAVWPGQPSTRPSVAASPRSNGQVRVFMSWNGATQVATWRVRGGPRPGALTAIASSPRSGFETMIVLHARPRYLAVQALNGHGKVIGTSPARKL